MRDIGIRMEIEDIINKCYAQTFDMLKNTEGADDESHVFRTIIYEEDSTGVNFMRAFTTYYQGAFEGMFMAYFEDHFNRYPNRDEVEFIAEETKKGWKRLVDIAAKYAKLELEKNKLKIKKEEK